MNAMKESHPLSYVLSLSDGHDALAERRFSSTLATILVLCDTRKERMKMLLGPTRQFEKHRIDLQAFEALNAP